MRVYIVDISAKRNVFYCQMGPEKCQLFNIGVMMKSVVQHDAEHAYKHSCVLVITQSCDCIC